MRIIITYAFVFLFLQYNIVRAQEGQKSENSIRYECFKAGAQTTISAAGFLTAGLVAYLLFDELEPFYDQNEDFNDSEMGPFFREYINVSVAKCLQRAPLFSSLFFTTYVGYTFGKSAVESLKKAQSCESASTSPSGDLDTNFVNEQEGGNYTTENLTDVVPGKPRAWNIPTPRSKASFLLGALVPVVSVAGAFGLLNNYLEKKRN